MSDKFKTDMVPAVSYAARKGGAKAGASNDGPIKLVGSGSSGSEVAHSSVCYMVEIHVMELARRALEAGLENSQGALLEHDANLGRTTRKNRTTAEMLERDIENIQTALSLLPNQ